MSAFVFSSIIFFVRCFVSSIWGNKNMSNEDCGKMPDIFNNSFEKKASTGCFNILPIFRFETKINMR